MKIFLKKEIVLKIILIVWIVLWVVFLLREEKDDQYKQLFKLYGTSVEGKTKEVMGDELFEFFSFARANLPEGAEYRFQGFERFSIAEVRGRYYLWPAKGSSETPEYILVYSSPGYAVPGYVVHAKLSDTKFILRKD